MPKILTISIILFLFINATASAKDNKITTIDEALGAICGTDLQIGLQVFGIRDNGKSKKFQRKAMAVFKKPRQKRIMKFSINDAYSFPKLSKKTYALYRMEVCYQQMTGKNIPQLLSENIVAKLTKCETISETKKKYSCIGNVATKYSK